MVSRREPAGLPSPSTTAPAGIVAMAASAGGLQALSVVLSGLPADFPLPIVIVQHILATHPSLLADILDRRTPLCVREAQEGDRPAAGTVLTAPPGRHLLVRTDRTLALGSGELVNHCRPSADVLLASVAAHFGAGAIAVILSGSGVDGSTGVRAIHAARGVVLAQDEESADFPGMPTAAVRTDCVDHVLPLGAIAEALVGLVHGTAA